ncbi:iron-containing alcohol dehydrogenase [Candidatus Poribacteria bacterium]|jgi:alcohol dehydrogenase|nr:iron-containing alcohol dehydrogenase [Candidatus Poribacteria bacterium]MBT5532467.1 iron-containing alcohol dehydrogenase [Candidatus Poribacteria bacterium]MBT5709763.1 iron-containing alcohol dehydrogenase [Candidatus Poribacteria bacterium]MBT7804150.1 iron-containing alcohol dehydrogenase [Candidatus Poribacteria bacterium]
MSRHGAIEAFDHIPGPRVVCGVGSLARLGDLAQGLGGTRALVVTDAGVVRAGILERAVHSLRAASIAAVVYDRVRANPSSDDVAWAADHAREADPIDLIVGLGGGSAMDCAKGANFVLTNGGVMSDYWGYGKAGGPMLPSIGVPTTAGTGSEAQSYALISDPETHRKMACGDLNARFRAVILDASLTTTMPIGVTGATGMDALAHAVESYVSTKANPMSRLYAREAFALLDASFERALSAPDDMDARAAMLLGAHYSGAAIENSMLGAAHASANPLTARHGVPHGAAVGLMLPHVVAYNEAGRAGGYDGLGPYGAPGMCGRAEALRAAAGMPACLRDCGVHGDDLDALAALATEEWTAKYNPRPLTPADFRALYEAAL